MTVHNLLNNEIIGRLNRIILCCAVICLSVTLCLARGGGGRGGGGFGGGGRGGFSDGGGRGWGGGGDRFGGSVRYSGGDRMQETRSQDIRTDRVRTQDRNTGNIRTQNVAPSGGERQRQRTETRTRSFGDRSVSSDSGIRDMQRDRTAQQTQTRTYTAPRSYSTESSRQSRTEARNFSVPPSNIGSVRYNNVRPSYTDRTVDRTDRISSDRRVNNVNTRVSPVRRDDRNIRNTRPAYNDRHDGYKPGYRPYPYPGPRPHPGPGWHHPPSYWKPYHYNGWNYWHWNHHWYRPYYYCGSVWYFSVAAPIGIYIDTLPAVNDYQVIVIDNRTYYVINGDYYIKTIQNGKTVYVCTESPYSQDTAPTVINTTSDAPNPFDVMNNMSNFLSMQDKFSVSIEDTYDEPSVAGGAAVQRSSTSTVYVARPNELAMEYDGDDGQSRLLYNGVALYSINITNNVFSSAPMPSKIDDMLNTMSQKYGINLPLSDFLYSNPGQAMLAGTRSGQYVGLSIINGVTCQHLAFSGDAVDWEIWIKTGKQPLPMKLVIVYKNEEGKPRYTMSVNQWKLGSVPSSAFRLDIPQNARQVEMLPIQAADTQTADVSAEQATTNPSVLPGPPPAGAVPVQ